MNNCWGDTSGGLETKYNDDLRVKDYLPVNPDDVKDLAVNLLRLRKPPVRRRLPVQGLRKLERSLNDMMD